MGHRFLFIHILVGLVLWGYGIVPAHGEVTVDASLSHLSFPVGQAAQLTITVTGSSDTEAIEIPEVDNIRTQYRGKSSQINVINGTVSSSISHTYLVQSLKPGEYTLPPVTVRAGGQPYATEPLYFTVTGNGQKNSAAAVAPRQNRDEPVIIRISETAEHYPGEIVPITIKAYFSQQFRTDRISLPTLQGDGVVMEQLQDKPHQGQEQLDGKLYTVLSWDTTISGVKVGKHPISFALEATLLIPEKRRARSPFGGGSTFGDSMFNDPFFDSFFGGYQRKPVSVASPQRVFTVLPLPTEKVPENFTGAIGDFDLKVAVNPVDVEVGEPMTLTMKISGKGNFDRVEAPVFPENPNWKTYSPTATSNGVEGQPGEKTFEQALVPKNSDATEIPSLSFSFFDPGKKEYITRISQPIGINLHQSAREQAPQPPSETAALPEQQPATPAASLLGLEGLAPLHLETGSFESDIEPLFMKSWFILLCALCLITLFALFALKMRKLKYARHPEILNERNRRLQLKIDLKKIEQILPADGTAFLPLARTAIQNQLGALWDTYPTAISLADIQARLDPDSPLVAIFRAADDAAYSGAPLSAEKMREYYEQMKVELEKLL